MSLKTSVGAPDANSFITLEEASDYLDSFGDDMTVWDALEDGQQEIRLILAAQAITSAFPFRGYKAYTNQALAFPRAVCESYVSPSSFYSISYGSLSIRQTATAIPLGGTSFTEIPEDVKQAQAYIAYHVIHKNLVNRQDPSDPEILPPSNMPISSFSVRGISVSFKDTGGTSFINALDQLVTDENSLVYLLLNKYISQIRFTRGTDKPDLLTYVPGPETTTTTVTTTSSTTSTTTTGTTTSSTTTA